MSVCVDIIATSDPKYPYRVRVTTRDTNGQLVGVRNLRAATQADAHTVAATWFGGELSGANWQPCLFS